MLTYKDIVKQTEDHIRDCRCENCRFVRGMIKKQAEWAKEARHKKGEDEVPAKTKVDYSYTLIADEYLYECDSKLRSNQKAEERRRYERELAAEQYNKEREEARKNKQLLKK